MPFIAPVIAVVAAIFTVVSAIISIIQIFNPPKPATLSFGYGGDVGGSPRYGSFFLDNTISNELAVPVLYGKLKVAGNVIWQTDAGTTVSKIVALCEGEICSIDDIRANDLLIETGQEAPGSSATPYTGTTTQETDSRVPAVTASGDSLGPNMNLRNVAYIAATLVASEQLKGASPTITSIANGMLIKTWNGGVWSSGKSYSNNPAAIIRDLLTNDRYGLGIPEVNIDDASFGETYDYCGAEIGV